MTTGELDEILALMTSLGMRHLSYSDGRDKVTMTLRHTAEESFGMAIAAAAQEVRDPEVIKTTAMGRVRFSHPMRPDDAVTEGAEVSAGSVVAYVIVGATMTAVCAPKAGRLGHRLTQEGDIVGYGTPVFQFQAIG